VETTETEDVALPPLFTAADRCDRCGAQAHLLASMINGILLFCRHHGHKYEKALLDQGAFLEEDNL
jgi:hypothetical protein